MIKSALLKKGFHTYYSVEEIEDADYKSIEDLEKDWKKYGYFVTHEIDGLIEDQKGVTFKGTWDKDYIVYYIMVWEE